MMEMDSDQASFDAEMNRVLEEGSEVFILSIEVFKTAISSIFSPEQDVAEYAVQLADECNARGDQLRHQTVGLLAQWAPKGDALHRVVIVERTAAESLVICQHGRHIAERALALAGTADQYFALAHQQAPDVFLTLVQQVYIGLRGCLVLTSTRDQSLASRVIAEDAQIHHLQRMLTERLEQASFEVPQHAGQLRHLVEIVLACRQIGLSVLTICRDALAAPRYIRTPSFRR
jgi:phosphate uptake regulator